MTPEDVKSAWGELPAGWKEITFAELGVDQQGIVGGSIVSKTAHATAGITCSCGNFHRCNNAFLTLPSGAQQKCWFPDSAAVRVKV